MHRFFHQSQGPLTATVRAEKILVTLNKQTLHFVSFATDEQLEVAKLEDHGPDGPPTLEADPISRIASGIDGDNQCRLPLH